MGLILVHSAATPVEGHLMRSRLEAEGIPVLMKGELDTPYPVGPVYLWVEEEHEVQARLVLAEIEAGGVALDDPDDELDGNLPRSD